MQKAVSSDVEPKSSPSLSPLGVRNSASMVVSIRCRSFHGEGAERVLSLDRRSGGRHATDIDRGFPYQLMGAPKRRRREVVCAYEVAVAAGGRAVPRVKLFTHFESGGNPYIVRKNGIHRSAESSGFPFFGNSHRGGLASGMNTRVGSARSDHCERCSAKPSYRRLEHTLNGPFVRLPLPAGKARAIIVQHHLHATRHHWREITRPRFAVKERNSLKMIDFTLAAAQCGTSSAIAPASL